MLEMCFVFGSADDGGVVLRRVAILHGFSDADGSWIVAVACKPLVPLLG